MTLFDVIALVILVVSGLVGFTRGAVRELVTVFAFTLSAMAAIYLMPLAGPFARRIVGPAWAGNAAAVVIVFLITYILLRLAGGWITDRLHAQPALGSVNRTLGLGFGVVRALVFLGVFYLVFNMATPPELVPAWISKGKLYPLARASGRVIGSVAPKVLRSSSHVGPAFERAITDEDGEDKAEDIQPVPGAPPATASRTRKPVRSGHGYDKRTRDNIDALVERTR